MQNRAEGALPKHPAVQVCVWEGAASASIAVTASSPPLRPALHVCRKARPPAGLPHALSTSPLQDHILVQPVKPCMGVEEWRTDTCGREDVC